MHLKRWFQWAYSVWSECSWKEGIGQEANITWKGAFIWYIGWEVNELRKKDHFSRIAGWELNAHGMVISQGLLGEMLMHLVEMNDNVD